MLCSLVVLNRVLNVSPIVKKDKFSQQFFLNTRQIQLALQMMDVVMACIYTENTNRAGGGDGHGQKENINVIRQFGPVDQELQLRYLFMTDVTKLSRAKL